MYGSSPRFVELERCAHDHPEQDGELEPTCQLRDTSNWDRWYPPFVKMLPHSDQSGLGAVRDEEDGHPRTQCLIGPLHVLTRVVDTIDLLVLVVQQNDEPPVVR